MVEAGQNPRIKLYSYSGVESIDGFVGHFKATIRRFVPTVFERANAPVSNAVALVIGPPIMIKNTIRVLERTGAA